MKWFSLLTVGLISLCSMGFAQTTKNVTIADKAPVREILTQNFLSTNLQLLDGQLIPFGNVVTIWKGGFSLSKDQTIIRVKKSGSYQVNISYNLTTTDITPPFIGLRIQFSENGKTNWITIGGLSTTGTDFQNYNAMIPLSSSGYLRVAVSLQPGANVFLLANPIVPAVQAQIVKQAD